MDGSILQIAIYLAAAFLAALVAGVTGFAFAPIAAGVWLHMFTPLETAGLPAIALGTWAGFAIYGRLDEDKFRKAVLIMLLASGLLLLLKMG